MSAYILTGIYFEERSLAAEHGAAYRDYQTRVPKLMPTLGANGQQKGIPMVVGATRMQ